MFKMLMTEGELADRPEHEARKIIQTRNYCFIAITSGTILCLAVAVIVLAVTIHSLAASRHSNQSSSLLVSKSGSAGPSTSFYQPISDRKKVPCPQNFVNLDGRCYYFSTFIVYGWSTSQHLCKGMDPSAHLVNIETESEWNTIKKYLTDNQLLKTQWWIGGSDRDKEGQWMWVATNQTFTFTKWCAEIGNDNYRGAEHYAHITYWKNVLCWNDNAEPSDIDTQFICEA